MKSPVSYECPKCSGRFYELREISTTGKFWTRIFNLQVNKFTAVICKKCRYTELYHSPVSKFGQVVDFVAGS
ncbi:MAG: GTP-binding protein [Bacteroidales bacterium]|jgi:predicted nucleic-acid-binding Zn-ribbon protein|nr:GTP-binding protein [Bacteroidales bacterium]